MPCPCPALPCPATRTHTHTIEHTTHNTRISLEREATCVLSRVATSPKIRQDAHLEAERSGRRARSHPHSGLQRERTRAGRRRKREKLEQPSSGTSNLHAQHAEGGKWCLLEQQPTDHAQHVEQCAKETRGRQRRDRGRRRKERRAERADPQRAKRATHSGQKSGLTAGKKEHRQLQARTQADRNDPLSGRVAAKTRRGT